MKQYTVTFVVRATINRPDNDEGELPDPRYCLDEYDIQYASFPEVIDVETIEYDSD